MLALVLLGTPLILGLAIHYFEYVANATVLTIFIILTELEGAEGNKHFMEKYRNEQRRSELKSGAYPIEDSDSEKFPMESYLGSSLRAKAGDIYWRKIDPK